MVLPNPGGCGKACAPPPATWGPQGLCGVMGKAVSRYGLAANPPRAKPGGGLRRLLGSRSCGRGSSSSKRARLPRCLGPSSSSRDFSWEMLPGRLIGAGLPMGCVGIPAAASNPEDGCRACVGGGASLGMEKIWLSGNCSPAVCEKPGGGMGIGGNPRPPGGPLMPGGGGIIMFGVGRKARGNMASCAIGLGKPGGRW